MMSRDIADDKIDFEEALKRFEYIMEQKPYSLWVKTVAVAFCCGFLRCCLAVMRLTDLIRLWSVRLSMFFIWFLRKHHTAEFIINIFRGGVVIALLILLFLCNRFGKKILIL